MQVVEAQGIESERKGGPREIDPVFLALGFRVDRVESLVEGQGNPALDEGREILEEMRLGLFPA